MDARAWNRTVRGLTESSAAFESFAHLLMDSSPPEPGLEKTLEPVIDKLDDVLETLRMVACPPQDIQDQELVEPEDLQEIEELDEVSSRCAEVMIEELTAPLPKFGTVPGSSTLHGTAPDFPVPCLIEFLGRNGKTGTLQIHANGENFTLELRDGAVVHAVTDCRPPEEQLGTILVDRGAIEAEQLSDLVARCESESIKMGEVLSSEQLVSCDELRRALQQQIQQLFQRLFTAEEANFDFFEGDPTHPQLHAHVGVMELLLESARVSDESTVDD